MQVFLSEYNKNYSTYTFSYAVYAVLEAGDTLADAYGQGFLPYAGASEYTSKAPIREICYRCRSLRINLANFSSSSENRRIIKKAAAYDISFSVREKEALINDASFHTFCQSYASERFKGGHMDEERWAYVLRRASGTHVVEFTIDETVLGYVLIGMDKSIVHYWFAFFDTSYLSAFPVGKYIMHAVIDWAKTQGKKYVYLGTCYGPGALYKARDFKGVQFFDGSSWLEDISILKSWCKADDEPLESDRYKLNENT